MIPDNMLPNQTAHAIHLRNTTNSAAGKDWVAVVTHDPFYGGKLWIINGPTKDVMKGGGQGRAVKAPGTESALIDAVSKKLADGYTRIDEYESRNGCWNSERSQRSQPTPTEFAAAPKTTTPPAPKVPITTPSDPDGEDAEPTMCW